MSSLPLLSHHLFVAAVNEGNTAARDAGAPEPQRPEAEGGAKEISIEFAEPGTVLPLQIITSTNALGCAGSA